MRFSVRLAALAATLAAVAPSAYAADVRDGRRIVWRDEFDGTGVNSAKWRFRKTMTANDCVYTNDERTVKVDGELFTSFGIRDGDDFAPEGKLGMKGFIAADCPPAAFAKFHQGDIGYHLRHGDHYISREDWNLYIDFLEAHP